MGTRPRPSTRWAPVWLLALCLEGCAISHLYEGERLDSKQLAKLYFVRSEIGMRHETAPDEDHCSGWWIRAAIWWREEPHRNQRCYVRPGTVELALGLTLDHVYRKNPGLLGGLLDVLGGVSSTATLHGHKCRFLPAGFSTFQAARRHVCYLSVQHAGTDDGPPTLRVRDVTADEVLEELKEDRTPEQTLTLQGSWDAWPGLEFELGATGEEADPCPPTSRNLP